MQTSAQITGQAIPPQTATIPVGDETLYSCKLRIAWLEESLEENSAQPVGDTGRKDAIREISRLHVRMGDIYLEQKNMALAAQCYETALKINPLQMTARMNILKTRPDATREDVLKAFLTGLLLERAHDAALHNKLGRIHFNLHELDAAFECFTRAIALNPADADSLYGIADTLQARGELEKAKEFYLRATKVQPLVHGPANKPVPDFSALVIMAPLLGNTPLNYLMNASSYERNVFPLFEDTSCDIARLKQSGHVVVNAISEADVDSAILPKVTGLIDSLGLPVINHPAKVERTRRENIFEILQGVPNCRMGRIVRHTAGDPATEEALQAKIPFPFPVLARPVGTHGGNNFEMIENPAALVEFIGQNPGSDHYLIEYVNYRSPDGHFRKYRFFFIDGQIMPYHLAIGDRWKVHHNTTDMIHHQWMKDEEKAFLENPSAIFSPHHFEALCAIQRALGLEYCGIDCGITDDNDLVVFEANATMIVHPYNADFPYKTPFVENIKHAFGKMLAKHAQKSSSDLAH